jgi:hypothetical protein
MINHERTMARWKQSVILFQDDDETTQVIYKQTTET